MQGDQEGVRLEAPGLSSRDEGDGAHPHGRFLRPRHEPPLSLQDGEGQIHARLVDGDELPGFTTADATRVHGHADGDYDHVSAPFRTQGEDRRRNCGTTESGN